MLQLIRNNSPFTVIILFIFTILVKMQFLLHPVAPVVTQNFLFEQVVTFFDLILFNNAFAYTLLAIIMLFGQAIYLNAIAIRHKLYGKQTYYVAFLYLSLTSLYPAFNYFSEVLLANWFIISALNIILNIHQTSKPRSGIFNIGFLISMAAILHAPSVFLFLLVFVSVSLLRRFNPSEWLVGLVGYLTPIYFFVTFLYLFNMLDELPGWIHLGISLPRRIPDPIYIIGLVVGVIMLLSMGTYSLQKQIVRASIFTRRGWTVIASMLFFSMLVAVFTPFEVRSGWLIALPALSLVVAPALYSEKNKLFSNFVFYFSLLLIVYCQFTANF
ncbi:MAG: DUF6427 family protein [Flavipsychrobacter sp.]